MYEYESEQLLYGFDFYGADGDTGAGSYGGTSCFDIYTSIDGNTWTKIDSYTVYCSDKKNVTRTFNPVVAKYIKIEMTQFNNSWDGGKAGIYYFNTYGIKLKL